MPYPVQRWDKSPSNTSYLLNNHLSHGWRYQPFEQSNPYELGCARTSIISHCAHFSVLLKENHENCSSRRVRLSFILKPSKEQVGDITIANLRCILSFVSSVKQQAKALPSRAKNYCFSPEALYTCADS